MSIFEAIAAKNVFWSLPASRLPPNIREYVCEMVIDELQTDGPKPKERMYLRFAHPQQGTTFQLSLDEFHTPASSIYEAEINVQDIEDPQTKITEKFDSICFTGVHNYQRPVPEIKELEFNENSAYHSDDEICNYFELDSGHYHSDEDDDYSLIDFAPENQKEVRYKVLIYLKNPVNRLKKMKDIKAHLKSQKFNVPDNHLKIIVANYCGSHIPDRKKGYLVHADYLSIDEKNQRLREEEELLRKEREKEMKKEKKKPGKKETAAKAKAESSGKKTIQITQQEVYQQYEKTTLGKSSSAKAAREMSLPAKQPPGGKRK